MTRPVSHLAPLACAGLLAALAVWGGCARDPAGEAGRAGAGSAPPPAADPAPQRILPANASALDFLARLVEPERVLALPPTARAYSGVDLEGSAWSSRPFFARYDAETVLTLEPDLVVTHQWQSPETVELLRRTGLEVLNLPSVDGFDDVLESIRQLGRALAAEDRAQQVVEELRRRKRQLALPAGARSLRILSYSNLGSGGWTAAEGTTADLMIRWAGHRNAASEVPLRGHVQIDLEQLLDLDPDVLLVAAAEHDSGFSPTARYLESEPMAAGLRAVRLGQFAVLPVALFNSNSPTLLDAAERLADTVREWAPPADGEPPPAAHSSEERKP